MAPSASSERWRCRSTMPAPRRGPIAARVRTSSPATIAPEISAKAAKPVAREITHGSISAVTPGPRRASGRPSAPTSDRRDAPLVGEGLGVAAPGHEQRRGQGVGLGGRRRHGGGAQQVGRARPPLARGRSRGAAARRRGSSGAGRCRTSPGRRAPAPASRGRRRRSTATPQGPPARGPLTATSPPALTRHGPAWAISAQARSAASPLAIAPRSRSTPGPSAIHDAPASSGDRPAGRARAGAPGAGRRGPGAKSRS